MFSNLVATVLAVSLILPACVWAKSPTSSIQPVQLGGKTFCTVFSINQGEGNWGTAGHCAQYAWEIFQTTGELVTIDGKPAYVAYIDPLYDIAVFQSGASAPALKMAKETHKIGDFVEIIGYPYGLTKVITRGSVGARNIPILHPTYNIHMRSDILDVTVAGGNSGSPVFNKKGDVVGVLWGSFTSSPHSLSVPLEALKRAMIARFWE